jgi:hypothetical protein
MPHCSSFDSLFYLAIEYRSLPNISVRAVITEQERIR